MLDIHTHRDISSPDVECSSTSIISLSVGDGEEVGIYINKEKEKLFSVGLHPWQVDDRWEELIEQRLRPLLALPQVVAVGEAGLDRLHNKAHYPLQLQAFHAQALLAEKAGKPLVIHCVKAFDDLIRIRREVHPQMPWIIHGFRGKQIQATQLLHEGFYLSFGIHFNEEALRECPATRLFLETDESDADICSLYQRAAIVRGTTPEALMQQVESNIRMICDGQKEINDGE